MSRSQRLLSLIQILRRHRFPVTGAALAEELGITLRTLYRDIDTLKEQGAHIEGVAGLGFVLHPGFMLPPLMFTEEELEALALGSRWVAARADERLVMAARDALEKIHSVLPERLRNELDDSALLVGASPVLDSATHLSLRQAIKAECKAHLHYRDGQGQVSTRLVWPFALGYFDQAHVLVAWCELRGSFRHFRCDRILTLEPTEQRYPTPRRALLKAWRADQGIQA
ncbi:helix-turn-helix transcriptional regulator [Pseudomonas sp. KNUC1026]|uniref:helix-turn-helix transcriptional regulator n=1 Tax=Pseudomonas sp. KNUC1026 TaxID=2893890 RepID=UPI001F1B599F|nr:YafY family protein [Pseudomonas sp. KNUC1026]UFH50210.1 YafY family transcriptional regulator [Pseudomonas sp. KNUC1026]